MKTNLGIFIFVLLISNLSSAKIPFSIAADPQYKCRLHTDEVVPEANAIFNQENKVFPSRYLLKGLEIVSNADVTRASLEGYFRPSEDLSIEIDPATKLQLKIDHSTDLIYLCVYYNTQDYEHTHVSIYFLSGKNLAGEMQSKFTNKITSLLQSEEIKSSMAPISFEGLTKLPDLAQEVLQKIPGVNLIYALFKGVVLKPIGIIGGTVLEITRLKIQGIVLTPQGVDLESNIETHTPSLINRAID